MTEEPRPVVHDEIAVDGVEQAVAAVIDDHRIGYGTRLTRLVDGVSTYTATVEGHPPREFDDIEDAHAWARETAGLDQARLVIAVLRGSCIV